MTSLFKMGVSYSCESVLRFCLRSASADAPTSPLNVNSVWPLKFTSTADFLPLLSGGDAATAAVLSAAAGGHRLRDAVTVGHRSWRVGAAFDVVTLIPALLYIYGMDAAAGTVTVAAVAAAVAAAALWKWWRMEA